MTVSLRYVLVLTAAALLSATPGAAQQRPGLMGDLMNDVSEVEKKLVDLAKAMPPAKSKWRPAADVRSVREMFLHVAADNYLIPSTVGVDPDTATGIKASDYSTVDKYEKQKLTRDATVAALEKSFAHLAKAMADTPDARLNEKVTFFGQEMTVQQVWLATTTHLHEHLGQAIAYARMNGVVPPWSRKGG